MTRDTEDSWLPGDAETQADPGPLKSLMVSVGLLLSVAILPIGMIAVSQVRQAQERTKASYIDELETQTARAAQPERDAITAAFGLAKGLASAVSLLDPDGTRCTQLMAQSQEAIPDTQFVGFLRDDGISICNNRGRRFDFSSNADMQALFEEPQPNVSFNPAGDASGQAVMVVSQPVFAGDGRFLGFISMSVGATPMAEAREVKGIPRALDLVTFNAEGALLTADMIDQPIEDVLPHNITLPTLGEIAPSSFEATTRDGTARYYAVTAIYPGQAYALASWDPAEEFLQPGSAERTTLVFTVAMWLAGLLMAVGALYFLAVRPLSTLGRRMRRFASGRRVLQYNGRDTASRELQIINRIFERMARKIIRDEAELENALYERGVLLREVHHRVKNNLQLISSILNMELRKTASPELRQQIVRLQGRLSGLANVYRGLYESDSFSSVRMDTLLEPLLRQLSVTTTANLDNTRLNFDIDPVSLVPDQASQLALLAVEAFANALDHHAPDANGDSLVSVTLRDGPGDGILFEVANSIAPDTPDPTPGALGSQLIDAFVMQLDGETLRNVEPGRYVLSVTFQRAAFEPDPEDSTVAGTRPLLDRSSP